MKNRQECLCHFTRAVAEVIRTEVLDYFSSSTALTVGQQPRRLP